MRGRVFGIKKTYILTSLLLLVTVVFISLSLVTIFVFNLYYLWFFIFCLCGGVYQLLKGAMFRFDSAFYFGILLICVGGTGFYSTFYQSFYQAVLYVLAFSSASYFTFVFFNQKFHLYLAILLYFLSLIVFLFKIKIITTAIFVAIIVVSVLIFILFYTLTNHKQVKGKDKRS